jgi:hypothetical protein
MARCINGKTAPAAAYLEDRIALAQIELAANPVELCRGGIVQGSVLGIEVRARVHHFFVQPKLVKVIAKVVVRCDVPAAAPAGVSIQCVIRLSDRRAEERQSGIQFFQNVPVADQDSQQVAELGVIPVSKHERFSGAHRAAERYRAVEPRILNGQLCCQWKLVGQAPERAVLVPLREDDLAGFELLQARQHQPSCNSIQPEAAGRDL